MRGAKRQTSSNQRGKPKASRVIRDRVVKQEGNLRRTADKLNLNYQRLRQDLSDNTFSAADLKILCGAIGLPTDLAKLQSEYAFKLRAGVRGPRKIAEQHRAMLAEPLTPGDSGLLKTFDYYAARQEQVARVVDSAEENIKGLFHGLSQSDSLFLSIMDAEPIHWQEEQTAADVPRVAEAIGKGALIAYLHPNQALYEELRRFGSPVLEPGFVRARFKDFTEVLKLHLPQKDKLRVEKQVTCIEFKWPVLCVPHFRFALYHHRGTPREQSKVWATVTVPMMNPTRDSERQINFPIFELNKGATSFLHGLCRKAVTTALKESASEGTSPAALRELFKRLFPGARLE